ncbi:unnamed protein product [Anisakis simplex]|uniref:Uncharacterized protein n=1 Tax=Anisakis simplex TaxID=6269 RepID=A0A0M3KFN5_ANISI|nr:unnamed protein product [Anisakis simplex]
MRASHLKACNQAVSSQNSAPVTTSLPQNVAGSGSVYPVQIIPEAITAPTSSSSTFNVRQPIYSGCPSCEQQTLQQRPPRPETFNVQQTQQPTAMVTPTRQESVTQMMPQVSQVSQVMPPPTPTKRCDKSCNGVCLSQCSQKKLPSKVCKPACNQQCSKVCKRK